MGMAENPFSTVIEPVTHIVQQPMIQSIVQPISQAGFFTRNGSFLVNAVLGVAIVGGIWYINRTVPQEATLSIKNKKLFRLIKQQGYKISDNQWILERDLIKQKSFYRLTENRIFFSDEYSPHIETVYYKDDMALVKLREQARDYAYKMHQQQKAYPRKKLISNILCTAGTIAAGIYLWKSSY